MVLKKIFAALLVTASTVALTGCGADHSANPDSNVGVRRAEQVASTGAPANGPLPNTAFKAGISVADAPTKLRPGQKEILQVTVKKVSDTTWPAHGRSTDGYFQVNLGNFWFDSKAARITDNPYVRTGFPNDLKPGEEATVPLEITAPAKSGDYTLQVDLVQEMVSWFSEKGSIAPNFKVKVGD